MRDELNIFTGRAVWRRKAKAKAKGGPPPEEEEKGGLLIRDLWMQGMDSICDMRVVNTDSVFYQSKTPEKCLETYEREEKKKYLRACLNERRDFIPSVASVYRLLRVEAEVTLKRIAIRLAQKWQ